MVATLIQEKLYTPQEYLERRLAETRSEYINGRIYAMAETSMPHTIISGNVYLAIGNHLKSSYCTPMSNDMRVHIPGTGLYTYPDIVVACGEPEMLDSRVDTLINPILIIEVLSESTEAYDRGEKYAHYRRIPTLQEYIIAMRNHRIANHDVFLQRRNTPVVGIFLSPIVRLCTVRKHFNNQNWVNQRIETTIQHLRLSTNHNDVGIRLELQCQEYERAYRWT